MHTTIVDIDADRWVRLRTRVTSADHIAHLAFLAAHPNDRFLAGVWWVSRMCSAWNLTDEGGDVLPITLDNVLTLPIDDAGLIARELREAATKK